VTDVVDPFDFAPTTEGRQGKTFHDGDLIRILLVHLGQEW
jgi:hypothetical protein